MQSIKTPRGEFIFLFAITFIIATGVTWIRTANLKQTYQFIQHEAQLRMLQKEIQSCRVEWTRLSAPRRLDQIAKKIHLRPPRLDQIFKVRHPLGQSVHN